MTQKRHLRCVIFLLFFARCHSSERGQSMRALGQFFSIHLSLLSLFLFPLLLMSLFLPTPISFLISSLLSSFKLNVCLCAREGVCK